MKCELAQTRLHAYFDGELDAVGAAEFERHLESCPDCTAALASEESLRQSIQQAGLRKHAPESLERKVRSKFPAASHRTGGNSVWRWGAIAAALLLVTLLGLQVFPNLNPFGRQSTPVTAAVDAHLRSLQPGHLADVESTDQHTVKPWFAGKLDFSPPVRDFASDGFPLTGGRLDALDGRAVAALVYGRRKHLVNVFISRAIGSRPWSGSGSQQGYQWAAWQKDDLAFVAVSDVSAADLQEFKQLFLKN